MRDLKNFFTEQELDNGFVRTNIQPHTKDIAHLRSCCNGRITGNYYFLCKYFDVGIDEQKTLSEIARLQDTDPDSKTYGCFRWYREEPCIRDTNGAFFVLKPIVMTMLFCSKEVSELEQNIILPMFCAAGRWFLNECTNHGYFYPNKIASDGAMLLAIGVLTRDKTLISHAQIFWDKWLDYVDEYGWGWGENVSECYSSITASALDLALCCLEKNTELFRKLFNARSTLIDYIAYHDGYEFVPTIRTYNFAGLVRNKNLMNIAHITDELFRLQDSGIGYENLATMILHRLSPEYVPQPDEKAFHTERIFGNSYAATYKGSNIRLGTISRFPVMPGCYQNTGWGLGWQSAPVSVLALKHEMSFLRFAAMCEGKLYTHPAYDKRSAYLHTHLFSDENIPEINTFCNQANHTAVIVRTLSHIANKASYLTDEWYFQHFDGELLEYHDWIVFDYGDCVFAVKPLNGVVEVIRSGANIRLAQIFYDGTERLLVCRQWITAWAAVVLDNPKNWETQLDEIKTLYTEITDFRFPREMNRFSVACGDAQIDFDPYKMIPFDVF